MKKQKLFLITLLLVSASLSLFAGKIVRPWRSTTAIVKAGEKFEVWFDASSGQTVSSVQLRGAYNSVNASKSIVEGNWEYDPHSGNRYDQLITVTVPSTAPADRYDLVLKTSSGDEVSHGGVKVVKEFKDKYYVMHISDGHLYQAGYDSDTLLSKKSTMIDIANIMDVQVIVETGDNMYNVRNNPEREGYYFIGKSDIGSKGMSKAYAATFLTPGDHDAYTANDWPQATVEVNSDFFNDYWGVQNSCFKYGNGRFMMLNNAWNVSTTSGRDHQYQCDEAIDWLAGEGSGGNFFLTAGHCYDKMHEFIDDYKKLDLVLAGDKHHVRTDNPWPFDDGSAEVAYIAGSIRDHFEINLYRVDDNAGTFIPVPGKTAVASVLKSGDENSPSTWVPNLRLSYTKANNGSSSANSASIINSYGFPIYDAKIRFVVPKGSVYTVSTGTITQQFDGTSYRIVDVAVDVNANSTKTISVSVSGSATPTPTPPVQDSYTVLTSPADGAQFAADSSITIKVDAFDPDGISIVRFWVYPENSDAYVAAEDNSEPYEVSITLAEGSYSLKAKSKDNNGNAKDSQTVAITVTSSATPTPTPTPTPAPTATPTATPTPPPPVDDTYPAEGMSAASGCVIANNNAGYNGTGFVDMGGEATWFELSDVSGTGTQAEITIRYALAAGERPCTLTVNDANGVEVNPPATGSWTTWETTTVTVTLASGANTLRLTAGAAGGPNIDELTVTAISSSTDINIGDIIALTAVNGQYVSAANDGDQLIANRTAIGSYEKFEVLDGGDGYIGLKCVGNGMVVCAEKAGTEPLTANRDRVGGWESFTLELKDGKAGFIAKANGKYVCAENNGRDPLIANRDRMGSYESFNFTVIE